MTSAETVVIDTSMILAVFLDEPDAPRLIEVALSYERRVMSVSTWVECSIVCEGRDEGGGAARFDRIAQSLRLEILPFSVDEGHLARDAFLKFGKGRRTRASLSFGDCFSYAAARHLDAPLLVKGNDFIHTDIAAA